MSTLSAQTYLVDNFSLEAENTPFGPLVAPAPYAESHMAMVLNAAILKQIPHFLERVAQGLDVAYHPLSGTPLFARPTASDPHEDQAAREFWEKQTKEWPPGPMYALHAAPMRSSFYMPQETLLRIVQELQHMREVVQKEAVLVFQRPWLFAQHAVQKQPAPKEALLLVPGEMLAVQLNLSLQSEQAEYQRFVPENDVSTAAVTAQMQRKELYHHMTAHGLFAVYPTEFFDARYAWLLRYGFVTLASYASAAYAFYLHHQQSAAFGQPSSDLIGLVQESHLSLDWFCQTSQPPANWEDKAWTLHCEQAFVNALKTKDCHGVLGTFVVPQAHTNLVLYWHKEESNLPKLVKARLML